MSDVKSWDLVELYRKREICYKQFKNAIENLQEDLGEYSKKEIKENLTENLNRLESMLHELNL